MDLARESLIALGLTALESEIYLELASGPAMTGYRIAQRLGKPVANVYKAIESLQLKGAIVVDNSGSRFCKAIPPEELLATFERRFTRELDRAEKALSGIQTAQAEERTYELLTRDQIFERAALLLQNSKEVVLLDLFPEPLEELREEISACAKRNVLVTAMVYSPVTLHGVNVVVNPDGEQVRNRWPGQWLNLVIDAREHMLSFLASEQNGPLQAIWSTSRYLSWIYHCGLAGEMMAMTFIGAVQKKSNQKELKKIVERFERIRALQAPGYKELVHKFGLERPLKSSHSLNVDSQKRKQNR